MAENLLSARDASADEIVDGLVMAAQLLRGDRGGATSLS
jgi:hypothetical protein